MSNPQLRLTLSKTSLDELSACLGGDVSGAKQVGYKSCRTPLVIGGIFVSYCERNDNWEFSRYPIDWTYTLRMDCFRSWRVPRISVAMMVFYNLIMKDKNRDALCWLDTGDVI